MTKTANRGRPIDQDKQERQKQKLLVAAQELLADKPYRSVTIRELANHADVNSAMVGYYFKNKEGLFIALLDNISKQLFSTMQQISQAEKPLRSFIEMMISKFCVNKGFARLIHDELMASNSELSSAFLERFPKVMAKMLPKLILNNTEITDPTKANYAAYSLMMLIISPFITEPVRILAWGISDDEIQSPAWVDHIYSLFMLGCTQEKH